MCNNKEIQEQATKFLSSLTTEQIEKGLGEFFKQLAPPKDTDDLSFLEPLLALAVPNFIKYHLGESTVADIKKGSISRVYTGYGFTPDSVDDCYELEIIVRT